MHQQAPSQQYNIPPSGGSGQHFQGQQNPMGMIAQGNHVMGQRPMPPYRPPHQGMLKSPDALLIPSVFGCFNVCLVCFQDLLSNILVKRNTTRSNTATEDRGRQRVRGVLLLNDLYCFSIAQIILTKSFLRLVGNVMSILGQYDLHPLPNRPPRSNLQVCSQLNSTE